MGFSCPELLELHSKLNRCLSPHRIDPEATVGEKITKSRELESAGRESEGRDDDKCRAWVIDRRWRFWGGEVFCPCGGRDWKATLASTFEEEAELWALIAAKKSSAARKM